MENFSNAKFRLQFFQFKKFSPTPNCLRLLCRFRKFYLIANFSTTFPTWKIFTLTLNLLYCFSDVENLLQRQIFLISFPIYIILSNTEFCVHFFDFKIFFSALFFFNFSEIRHFHVLVHLREAYILFLCFKIFFLLTKIPVLISSSPRPCYK